MKGKVKDIFRDWYMLFIRPNTHISYNMFIMFTPSMQWGVLQDFYDSQGIKFLAIQMLNNPKDSTHPYYVDLGINRDWSWFKTRQEARQAALNKAEEILNGKI